MMKITAIILVDADNETEVFDGLNEGFRILQNEYGDWVVDWAYTGEPQLVAIDRAEYNEGQAFGEEARPTHCDHGVPLSEVCVLCRE